jgi:hypothetical protein
VDNTVYAPLSPTYPSAVAALRGQGSSFLPPVGVSEPHLREPADNSRKGWGSGVGDGHGLNDADEVVGVPTSLYAQPGVMRQAEGLAAAEAELGRRRLAAAMKVGAAADAAHGDGHGGSVTSMASSSSGPAGSTNASGVVPRDAKLDRGGSLVARDGVVNGGLLLLPSSQHPSSPSPSGSRLRTPQQQELGQVRGLPGQGLGLAGVSPPRVPLLVVGSGIGGDCAPGDANFLQFYQAAQGPAWELSLPDAGVIFVLVALQQAVHCRLLTQLTGWPGAAHLF